MNRCFIVQATGKKTRQRGPMMMMKGNWKSCESRNKNRDKNFQEIFRKNVFFSGFLSESRSEEMDLMKRWRLIYFFVVACY